MIDVKNLPHGGKQIEGKMPQEVFELEGDLVAKAKSGLYFDVYVERDKDSLLIEGWIKAEFELVCGRTLRLFPYVVELENYTGEVEIENKSIIDLTDVFREDILLSLPSYPVSEDSEFFAAADVKDDKFETNEVNENSSELSPKDVWGALDQLKITS
jgi:uncharacterized metal-binding protein YceD (DUF177 family)